MDHSADIIREYAEAYPERIRPIYQTENQHSKGGVSIIGDCILPAARGRYIAICEGDDRWCDPHKLQRQYDYMESHPECSVCLHNTIDHDLSGRKPDRSFNDWNEIHRMSDEDVFMGGKVHTSSFFFRTDVLRKCYPEYGKGYWFGDLIRLSCAMDQGEAVCLSQVMSVYNSHNPQGASESAYRTGLRRRLSAKQQTVDFLTKFNEATQGRHDEAIRERIAYENVYIEYDSCTIRLKELLEQEPADKEETIRTAGKLAENEYTRQLIGKQSGPSKWKVSYKYYGYRYGYSLWKAVMRKWVLPGISL